MTSLASHMRQWMHSTLRSLAPRSSCKFTFAPDDVVWNLTLDQIESGTGKILEKQETSFSEAGSSTFIFDENTVLYSKLRPYLNKVVWPKQRGVATTELVPLKPDPEVMLPGYLTYYLRSPTFLNFISNRVAGAKMPRVIMDEFWAHEIPHPINIREQERIVDLLDQGDALRRQRTEADTKVARLLPALFRHYFGDPIKNDRNWKTERLGTLTSADWGDTSITKASYTGAGYIAFSASGPDGFMPSFQHDEDGIIISAIGARCGRSFLARGKWTAIKNTITITKPKPGLDLRYVFGMANEPHFWPKHGGGQPFIPLGAVRDKQIILAPFDLQKRYGDEADSIMAWENDARISAAKLETLFQTLLHRAFTGELSARWREAHLREGVQEMTRLSRA